VPLKERPVCLPISPNALEPDLTIIPPTPVWAVIDLATPLSDANMLAVPKPPTGMLSFSELNRHPLKLSDRLQDISDGRAHRRGAKLRNFWQWKGCLGGSCSDTPSNRHRGDALNPPRVHVCPHTS